jgi:hypothetical protein
VLKSPWASAQVTPMLVKLMATSAVVPIAIVISAQNQRERTRCGGVRHHLGQLARLSHLIDKLQMFRGNGTAFRTGHSQIPTVLDLHTGPPEFLVQPCIADGTGAHVHVSRGRPPRLDAKSLPPPQRDALLAPTRSSLVVSTAIDLI